MEKENNNNKESKPDGRLEKEKGSKDDAKLALAGIIIIAIIWILSYLAFNK